MLKKIFRSIIVAVVTLYLVGNNQIAYTEEIGIQSESTISFDQTYIPPLPDIESPFTPDPDVENPVIPEVDQKIPTHNGAVLLPKTGETNGFSLQVLGLSLILIGFTLKWNKKKHTN